jgi:hypothetical protein
MEDVVIPKLGTKISKEVSMEQVITLRNLENTLSWDDKNILDPLEEVVYLQLIAYNRRNKPL